MANGKGWIDCIDCIHCEWTKDPWKRFCQKFDLLLPTSEELEHQHTVCADFNPKKDSELVLNSEIEQISSGANYYIHKKSGPFYKGKEPTHIEQNVLYAFHYTEHILRPFMNLNDK